MELIKDSKKIIVLINAITKTGKKLDDDIHLAACSCLAHVEKHGDATLASKLLEQLIEAMPRSGRTKALIHWFITYGKLAYKKDKTFGIDKGKSKKWDIEGAIAMPFWELIPEPDVKDLTMEALIGFVKNKIAKAQDSGKIEEGFTTDKFEKGLKAALAA